MSAAVHTLVVLVTMVVFALLWPPRWDPAIRIKEWQKRRWKEPW